jgi:hypothetical protein
MPIKYPEHYLELQEEVKMYQGQIAEAKAKMKEIKLQLLADLGWIKCCNQFSTISDDGFCMYCDYNHITRQYLDYGTPYNDDLS